jgi:hypothetical protein
VTPGRFFVNVNFFSRDCVKAHRHAEWAAWGSSVTEAPNLSFRNSLFLSQFFPLFPSPARFFNSGFHSLIAAAQSETPRSVSEKTESSALKSVSMPRADGSTQQA